MFFQYLMQRSGVFYFRRSIPRELRTIFPRTEIWQSLRTKERQSAELLARNLTAQTDKLFLVARLSMTDKDLQTAMRCYLDELLGSFERHRDVGSSLWEVATNSPLDPRTLQQDVLALEGGFPLEGPPTEEGLSMLVSHYERKIAYLTDCLRLRRFNDDSLRAKASQLISENQLKVIPPKEWFDEDLGECVSEPEKPDYQRLCRNILKTQVEGYKIEIERLRGNYSNSYDRTLEHLMEGQTAQALPSAPSLPEFPLPQLLASQAITSYMEEIRTGKNLRQITFTEYEDACRLFVRVIGDKPVADLTRDDVTTYRETLKRLPPHINKKAATRDKTIAEILNLTQQEGWETLSEAAVGKKFEQLKAFIKWASSGGVRLIPFDVSEGVTLAKSARGPVREEKKSYTIASVDKYLNFA